MLNDYPPLADHPVAYALAYLTLMVFWVLIFRLQNLSEVYAGTWKEPTFYGLSIVLGVAPVIAIFFAAAS